MEINNLGGILAITTVAALAIMLLAAVVGLKEANTWTPFFLCLGIYLGIAGVVAGFLIRHMIAENRGYL